MDKEEILKNLSINKYRQEIIDALLITWEHSNLILTIKALSDNPEEELIRRFGLTPYQANEIFIIQKPIGTISMASILRESFNLQDIRKTLKEDLKKINVT